MLRKKQRKYNNQVVKKRKKKEKRKRERKLKKTEKNVKIKLNAGLHKRGAVELVLNL